MPDAQGVPEVYADLAQISAGRLGVFLGFCAVNPTGVLNARSDTETQSETPFDLKAIVRLNHEDAKIFTIFLKRALKSYEEAEGEIKLPAEFVEAIELTADEW